MAGFGAMLLVLHIAIPPYGVPAALGLALGFRWFGRSFWF
jgi:hypothetical protein